MSLRVLQLKKTQLNFLAAIFMCFYGRNQTLSLDDVASKVRVYIMDWGV